MNTINNHVKLIGHLGKEVEVYTFENGSRLGKCTLATNDYYTNNKGDRIQETQWHNLIAWGKTADLMSTILRKGHEVTVHGKLVHRTYEDKEGRKRYVSEIIVSEFKNHTRKPLSPVG